MTPNSRKARNSEIARLQKVSAATSDEMNAELPLRMKASRIASSEPIPRAQARVASRAGGSVLGPQAAEDSAEEGGQQVDRPVGEPTKP